jgi:hypothetical protein
MTRKDRKSKALRHTPVGEIVTQISELKVDSQETDQTEEEHEGEEISQIANDTLEDEANADIEKLGLSYDSIDDPKIEDPDIDLIDHEEIKEYWNSTADHDEYGGEWISFKDKTFEQQCRDKGWLRKKNTLATADDDMLMLEFAGKEREQEAMERRRAALLARLNTSAGANALTEVVLPLSTVQPILNPTGVITNEITKTKELVKDASEIEFQNANALGYKRDAKALEPSELDDEDPIEVVREKKIKWLKAQLAIAESFETANELEIRRMNENLKQNQEAFSTPKVIIKQRDLNE